MKPRLLAVCHDCRHQHAIGLHSILNGNAVVDWEVKHSGHRIEFLDPEAYRFSSSRLAVGEYRHNADVKQAYAASADLTITLASLASDTNLLAGRESTAVDNGASNKYLDYHVGGKITTGTSPTDARKIEVWAYGAVNDTPTFPDVLDGTNSAETITSANIKNSSMKLLAVLATNNTSDRTYWFAPRSIRMLFGGMVPDQWGIFVVHNTAVNLNSTGSNHAISQTGTYLTVA